MAKRHMSRRQRNQAKWDAHASTHKTAPKTTTDNTTMPGLAGYAGGKPPVFATGSLSPVPRQPTVTQRKGINLKPFTDVIPSVPTDYATVKSDHVRHDKMVWGRVNVETGRECRSEACEVTHGDKCTVGRVWERTMPDRQAMDFERAKLDVRESVESTRMAVDRPSGAEKFHTYAARHEDDKAAGLYRDGLGRIMRTEDMEEYADRIVDMVAKVDDDMYSLSCELDDDNRVHIVEVNMRTGERRRRGVEIIKGVDSTMTTTDYARMHGVPIQRNTTQRAHAASKIRAAKSEARDAKRAAKEQDRLNRKLDRATGVSNAGHVSRREMDDAARAVLATHGVTNPTRAQMRAARDVIAHQKQIAAYVGSN
ncbi:hypothetical protein AB0F25_30435 [Streptomyces wedmorensis]|uniref:hypothetical protein n=1 Tax=Streptomyces wedmorensis TaxID=43759 RepID=UPI00344792AE